MLVAIGGRSIGWNGPSECRARDPPASSKESCVTPRISVLMPAYNAERFIRGSVNSVLAQTFTDFELIVVDDGSRDQTPAILASIRDHRLRVIRNDQNLGIVASLNRAMAAARGAYIARADADDFCLPLRLTKQYQFLCSHPEVLLVGSEMFNLVENQVIHDPRRGEPDPLILRWMFNLGNPIGHPSMMFHTRVIDALGCYLRKEFELAEDLDFSHRVLLLGEVATMPEPLGIYRRHNQSLTHARHAQTLAATEKLLRRFYEDVPGEDPAVAARLVARYVMAGVPARDGAQLAQIGALFDRRVASFLERHPSALSQQRSIAAHAARLWWRILLNSLRSGAVIPVARHYDGCSIEATGRAPWHRVLRSAARGVLPATHLGAWRRRLASRQPAAQPATGAAPRTVEVAGVCYTSVPVPRFDPPSIYVVAECGTDPGDDDDGFAAAAPVAEFQAVFDRYGARPIYLVDAALAACAGRSAPLQRLLRDEACAIGAQLVACRSTPAGGPARGLGKELAGGLEGGLAGPALDRQKVEQLSLMIRDRFGAMPRFFAAAPAPLSAGDLDMLAELGFAVGFGTTVGGAGPSREEPQTPVHRLDGIAGWVGPGNIRLMSNHGDEFLPVRQSGQRWRVRNDAAGGRQTSAAGGKAARLGRAHRIAAFQSMLRRGDRIFALRCHDWPATGKGVAHRSPAEELAEICAVLFDELGCLPGNPPDLILRSERNPADDPSGPGRNP
jgi:hypothetical protein